MAVQQQSPRNPGYVHEGPYDTGMLQVDHIHSLHYEQYGSRTGLPVVFLHGGPGGHTNHGNTKFFNPEVYRVVLFDQRGAGKSRPKGELSENTTHHLVADIEKIRIQLEVEQWHIIFGGSWGTTLGLVYAQAHPTRVKSLVLRGVTTMRKRELAHSRGGPNGAAKFFPEMYDKFVGFVPEEDRHDIITAYYKMMTSGDEKLAAAAAKEWTRWDLTMGTTLQHGADHYARLNDTEWSMVHAKTEAHYFSHQAWLEEGQILANANMDKIKHIRGVIVQGRYDLVTPPQTAWELHKAWPNSSIYFTPDAGHVATEPGTFSKLVEVCDELAQLDSVKSD